jgi:alpha-beta hydrolase superfamily lysophospholipase
MRVIAAFTFALPVAALAQPYPIGNRSVTFFDADRNRNIPTDVYYPAQAAGANAGVAEGSFPVLVIGHGFVMGTGAYANLRNHFVPLGYIVALPTTEGGVPPNHGAFGLDIAHVSTALQAAGGEPASPFFGHVAPATALMGHSMGGGSSFLAAAGNTSITTVVNFAAAETNPSAVAACAQVQVPTLMFAGSNDCVTPIVEHQGPMYEALTVPCRAFISITGGGHCYFADYNFNCSLGELTCSPSPSIERAEQHDAVNDFATLWLGHFLKGESGALEAFLDSTAQTTRAVCTTTCELSTGMAVQEGGELPLIWPTVADDRFTVRMPGATFRMDVLDAQGRLVLSIADLQDRAIVDAARLPQGTYLVRVMAGASRAIGRLVVAR